LENITKEQKSELFIMATISSDAHLSTNKNLIRNTGLREAVLLSDLISKYKFFKGRNQLTDEKWFFNTIINIQYDTGLSESQQRNTMQRLIDTGLIETKLIDMPAKRYFSLIFEKIERYIISSISWEDFKELKRQEAEIKKENKKNNPPACTDKKPDQDPAKSQIKTQQKVRPIYNKNNLNKNNVNKIILKNNKESLQDSDNLFKNQKQNSFDNNQPEQKKKKEYIIINNKINMGSKSLIRIWNDFEQTTTHKDQKPYSKTYFDLVTNLSKLQQGTFAKGKTFDPEWIKRNNIPEEYFTKAWGFQELKEAIINLSKYSLEGYWPETDKTFFKTLTNLIYNPRKKNSWIMTVMKNPPKELQQINKEKPFETEYPKTMTIIKESNIWNQNYNFDERKIEKSIKELKDFSDNIKNDDQDRNNHATYFFGDLQKIIREYLNWLGQDAQDWITKNEHLLDINGPIFTKFIESQEKELQINIKSAGWERK
jgi:hypothetical protein